jgi:C-terminal processing protease CtpA/Prc
MTGFCRALIGCLLFCGLLSNAWAGDEAFGGVGLQVVPTIDGDLVVLNVLHDTPAALKGLLPGDLIFQVDDFALRGSDFGKVVSEHLWGPVGSMVELSYRRPGLAGVHRVVLMRTAIDPRLTVTPTVKDSTIPIDRSK